MSATKTDAFYVDAKSRKDVPMMHMTAAFAAAHTADADAVALPYQDGTRMIVIVPKKREGGVAAIEKSKRTTLSRFLFGLGIRHVGETTAKDLARHFGGLDAIMAATTEQLLQVRDVGPVVAQSVRTFFDQGHYRMYTLIIGRLGPCFKQNQNRISSISAGVASRS